ncbi:MAG: hypothetical protein IJS01_04540 [Lentisphaeria bacterium]|nr:hypothetical protein [Lentisphaeria bacterium]
MKEIAYISLCPLGDVVCCMNQLEHLKKLYAPCRITVFAIPLIAELMKNSAWVDEVVVLKGNVRYDLELSDFVPPETEFDVVFNMSYYPVYVELQKRLKCKVRYGSECQPLITKELCEANFDKWVSQEYWDNVTLKKYRTVCEQMAEPIRLVDPEFDFVYPTLTPETYRLEPYPGELPEKFVLFLPGTSWIGKYWPVTKYLAAAKTLKAAGVDAVFAIGPQDRVLVPELEKSGFPVLDTLPFSQLAYVADRAELVIGNDSGPMHFAAAFHRKTIHIIASGSAFNWYPYEEPVHSLVMPDCASEEKCNSCRKTCIGKISVEKVVRKLFEKLALPQPRIREVAFMVQDRIGDSLVNIDALEAAAKICAPCNVTVFATETMAPFFRAYAFADRVIEFRGAETVLPDREYDAVFNYRYDTASLELLRRMKYRTAYGYEQIDFPESVCKEVFTKYLPLSMWDDVKLRRYTSVTEQGASLIRLVDPAYHCNAVSLAENTLCTDFAELPEGLLDRDTVLIVPGASSRYKDWGLENYLRLAADLKEKGKKPVFILGPQEKDLYGKPAEGAGFETALDLPLTSIAALAFACRHRGFTVGNDTGVMHLVRACGCPSVTVCFEDTSLTWAPYAADIHKVVHADCADYVSCRRCETRDCRKDMTYERVWHEVRRFLA